jgi:hypothetical protein
VIRRAAEEFIPRAYETVLYIFQLLYRFVDGILLPSSEHVGTDNLNPFSVNLHGVAIEVFFSKLSIDVNSSNVSFSFFLVEIVGLADAFI